MTDTPHDRGIEAAAWVLLHPLPAQGFHALLHQLDLYATAEGMIAAYLRAVNQVGRP